VWRSCAVNERYSFGPDPTKAPRFERLRKLRLDFVKFSDSVIANTPLEPALYVLNLSYYDYNDYLMKSLRCRGRIHFLES